MKITYQPNPLKTIVELDDHDKEILRLKLIIEEYEERLVGVHYYLVDHKDMEKAIQEIRWPHLCDDEKFLKRIDSKFNWMIDALSDIHVGDCTCQPCSCEKCWAESLIGIDTISGLGKHQANKIDGAFHQHDNINVALEILKNYNIEFDDSSSWKGHEELFNSCIPRWQREAKEAYEWLLAYKNKHFPD